jgi:hypothetical protein
MGEKDVEKTVKFDDAVDFDVFDCNLRQLTLSSWLKATHVVLIFHKKAGIGVVLTNDFPGGSD